jgi:HEPN domain-containing protein
MADAKLRLACEWLIKAKHDLDSARKLATDPAPVLDTAIYHCQQAAEKAIKGLLAFRGQRFEKTHDVRLLTAQAASVEPRFSELLEEAELLTPYATAFRYPDEFLQPSLAEFNRALRAAERVYESVLSTQPELRSD